jgi:hypothetical protein
MRGRLKFMHEAQDRTAPNRIVLNRTMQSLTKAHIAILSCVDKPENTATLKLTDTIFSFFLTLSI